MKGGRTYNESRTLIDDIINQAQNAKAPKKLPDFEYTGKTMESGKLKKEIIGLSEDATTNKAEKTALRELFGEVKDPRFTLHTAMTNLSGAARTSAYLADIIAKNKAVQADVLDSQGKVISKGKRGFFWDSEDAAKLAVDQDKTGIQLVTERS